MEAHKEALRTGRGWAWLTGLTLDLKLGSLAGIYSVMAFTVSRRTREIAIRMALGTRSGRVIFDTLGRPLGHVAAGVAAGCVLMGCLVALSAFDDREDVVGTVMNNVSLLLGYGVTMLGVCAVSCLGPILRALRLEPTQALRDA